MAMRFRKSIKLAPGIRMNLSGAGVGWTLGPRGASVGIGKRGARLNTSFMGISSSQKLSGPSRSTKPAATKPASTFVSVTCSLHDDGSLTFQDAAGNDLPEHVIEAVKKQNKDAILAVIQRKCDEINGNIDALGTIHLDTPNCTSRPVFVEVPFGEPEPVAPAPLKPSLLDRLFKKRMLRLEARNAEIQKNFAAYYDDWSNNRGNHTQLERDRKLLINEGIYTNTSDMEAWLEDNLQDIQWPRETAISLELLEDGQLVLLDVDLPEIEDMPSSTASVPSRGLKLSVKAMSTTAVQKLYMAHVHAVAFRIIGETFAALPKATTVVLSGYSQRPGKATGRITDEYLFSVRVNRTTWGDIDFGRLADIDVVEALARFDLRRQMSKTGIFKAIDPFHQ
ncbi:DUF4236 domain-containing protein [Pseudomonas veronii]|jgi:hypothetical protein|uniref:DUF4236 domain-containing protein n=1 Tax=Pseudomonas TaxID=286 RepID=UPI001CA44077|nr:DUF4236 domain-containing protein [Pseudomonas veronii]MCT8959858.1 DUF4236 domain-containing protein [Pseudomonas veronii]